MFSIKANMPTHSMQNKQSNTFYYIPFNRGHTMCSKSNEYDEYNTMSIINGYISQEIKHKMNSTLLHGIVQEIKCNKCNSNTMIIISNSQMKCNTCGNILLYIIDLEASINNEHITHILASWLNDGDNNT